MKGDKSMTRPKDPDNFQYARSKDAGGIEFTVTPQQAGEWYVFVKVRVGATTVFDQHAAVLTLCGTDGEAVVSQRIVGSRGDDSWQVVCVGKQKLEPKMKLRVAPGGKDTLRFLDVRNFLLVTPVVMESTVPQPAK